MAETDNGIANMFPNREAKSAPTWDGRLPVENTVTFSDLDPATQVALLKFNRCPSTAQMSLADKMNRMREEASHAAQKAAQRASFFQAELMEFAEVR